MAECMRGIGFGDQREQVTEAGGSENKIALFVRLVQGDHAFIPAEPVKYAVWIFDFAVIAFEYKIRKKAAAISHAARACDRICQMSSADRCGIGADCAGQDAASQFFAVIGQIQARDQ